MRYDAVIIGAGMSGLAAGIRLAHFGKRVVILERHYLFGGLNSFYKLGGRRFDTGLHALTNFTPKGTRKGPLAKILRQLRISHDELHLGQHEFSEVAFDVPERVQLRFSNEPELFFSEVARDFPEQLDALRKLADEVPTFTDLGTASEVSARAELARRIDDPLLVEMLLCPTCWYGAAGERDLPWDQFGVLFRSIFSEGLARPEGGIKPVLDLLVKRFKHAGGELRMKCGVSRIVTRSGTDAGAGRAVAVQLDDGTELETERVFSSAGWVETMSLAERPVPAAEAGVLSFVEALSVMDKTPAQLGHRAAITWYNTGRDFAWERPAEGLVDTRTGVLCCPDNYAAETPVTGTAGEGLMRVTVLADYDRWTALGEDDYRAAKDAEADRALEAMSSFAPDPRPHTIFRDVFTPRTLERFTWHTNGTVYGSPAKRLDGRTGIDGLYLIGTDQGLVGVIGALMSGIGIANRYGLADDPVSVAPGTSTGAAR